MKGFKNSTRTTGDHCFAEGGRVDFGQGRAPASVKRAAVAEGNADAAAARKLGMTLPEYNDYLTKLVAAANAERDAKQKAADMARTAGVPGFKSGGRVRGKGVPVHSGKPLIGK